MNILFKFDDYEFDPLYFQEKIIPAILAAVFSIMLFKVKDWFDEYRELKKINIKFINLYEELKKVNSGIDKVYGIFEEFVTKLKDVLLGSIRPPNRVLIPSADRIDATEKDFIFHRLILFSADRAKSIETYRELLDSIKLLNMNINKAYSGYEDNMNQYNDTFKLFRSNFEELKTKIVSDINDNKTSRERKVELSECYQAFQKSKKGPVNAMELVEALKGILNFQNSPNLNDEQHKLIFDCEGAFMEMNRLSVDTSSFSENVIITLKNLSGKLKNVENDLKQAMETQGITINLSFRTFIRKKIRFHKN